MKKSISLTLLFTWSLAAQSTPSTVAEEVMKVEEAYRVAKLNRDVDALNLVLAEGFNETNQNGNSRSKSETIELWTKFRIASLTTDTHEVRVNSSTAMVIGTQTENGKERMLFMRVYVKNSDGWKLFGSMQFRNPKLPNP